MAITVAQRWYAGAAAASLGVLAAGYFLLVSPQQSNASDLTAQAAAVEQANVAAQHQVEALKAEYQDLPALQSQVAAIRTRLPQTPEEPTLLRTISALAKSSGVTLTSIGVQTPTSVGSATAGGGQVKQLPLNLDITGSFANTRLFLNGVESMQRSMMVTAISINRASAGAATATAGTQVDGIHTVITARVFMASAPSTPTVGTAAAAGTGATSTTQPS